MGALQMLTLALRRLDPTNTLWEELQKAKALKRTEEAFNAPGQTARDDLLAEISDTFERYRTSDFGRKLYLIQNSLFGVDIQPIACQIAKLRFFISLVIEQDASESPEANYGIRPLPNLETRFVSADTLLTLQSNLPLTGPKAEDLERALRVNRERHFHAQLRADKLKIAARDGKLRNELASELEAVGMPAADARRCAAWDPYDQNAPPADWFDAAYMFGVRSGFDVVIGNPPYIQLQKNGGELGSRYKNQGFETFDGRGDVYQLFVEQALRSSASERGVVTFILSDSWQRALYGKEMREWIGNHHSPLRLVNLGPGDFENAVVSTCILIVRRGRGHGECRTATLRGALELPPREDSWGKLRQVENGPWCVLSASESALMEKIEKAGKPLRKWDISIYRGVTTGLNEAFIVDNTTKEALIREDQRSAELLKPLVRGRDIERYAIYWKGLWLIDSHNGGAAGLPPIVIDALRYPAIKAHLDQHQPRLSRRYDQGATPYNLRSWSYGRIWCTGPFWSGDVPLV